MVGPSRRASAPHTVPCRLQLHGGRTGVEGPPLSRSQRLLFGMGYVVLPYLWHKVSKSVFERERSNDP
jgi:hypothetical protein